MKYNELKKRIRYVALAATPVPFLDIVANYKLFVSELHRYVQVFGLDKEFVPSVPRLKNVLSKTKESKMNWKVFLSQNLAHTYYCVRWTITVGSFLPVFGSMIPGSSNAYLYGSFLNKHLDELKEDALTVYWHFNTKDK